MKKIIFALIIVISISSAFLIQPSRKESKSPFLDPPGTVIYVSRDSGFKFLSDLARLGEPELSLIYLPLKKVWVTVSIKRYVAKVISDINIVDSIIENNSEIEWWHTHTNVGIRFYSKEDSIKRSLWWLMPASADLAQIHYCISKKHNLKVKGIIATKYGATHFWTDSSVLLLADKVYSKDSYNFILRRLSPESDSIQTFFHYAVLDSLSIWASKYRGAFSLKFEPVPK